jgi:hypothetical protein
MLPADDLPRAISDIDAQGQLDGSTLAFDHAIELRHVGLLDEAIGEERLQITVGCPVLGRYQESRGVEIETMDE